MAVTVIGNARIFDGHQMRDPADVVIDGGLISAAPAPSAAHRIDGAGGTLLPGLIDTHAHMQTRAHLEAMAAWGVTTALDMGAPDLEATRKLRHLAHLPDLRTAGRPASGPGSTFIVTMGHPASTGVTGPADAGRFVADRIADGSDYIKIIVEDPAFPGAKPLSGDTIAAIVTAAHAAGLLTVAHVVSARTLCTAVAAGVDVVTHTTLTGQLGDACEQLLADRPVTIIPTLTMMRGVEQSIGRKLPIRVLSLFVPAVRMRYRYAEATVAAFRRAHRTVLAGTDANDNPHSPFNVAHGRALHEELERLVGAGLTPIEALRGATSAAAETFRLPGRGTIAAGQRADLVLVGGDPSRDITSSRNIRGVWIAGSRVGDPEAGPR